MSAAAGLRARFLSNMRAHVVSRLVQGAVGLVLVPYVLSHLSREQYGLWSWLLAMASWMTLADLGLSHGNVNALTRSLESKDERRVGEILVAAIGLHLLLTLAIVALVLASREPLMAAMPPAARGLGWRTLLLLVFAQGLVVTSFPFGALLSAHQRLDLVHKVQTALLVLQAIATVVILESGGRVAELAWMQLGLGAFQLTARVLLCLRLLPSLRPAWPVANELPSLLSAGLPVLLLGLTGTVALSFERTFLGFVVDLALLAQYAVAARLVMTVREIPQVLLSALIPASAALDVAGDDRALARLYGRSFKVAVTVVLALVAALSVCAPAALAAWLGPGFEPAGRVARPLAFAILIPLLTAPGTHILTGRSRLGRLAPVYALWGAAFVAGNALWLSFAGFAGAGWGAAVINVAGTGVLLHWMHRHGALLTAGTTGFLARGTAAATAAAFAGNLFVWVAGGALGGDSRLAALAVATCGAAGVGGTHIVLAWMSGLLDAEDRRLLADALGFRRYRAGGA